jgi:hypothetical protein
VIRLLLPTAVVAGCTNYLRIDGQGFRRVEVLKHCQLGRSGLVDGQRTAAPILWTTIDAILAFGNGSTLMAIEIERRPMSVQLRRRWITALAAGMILLFTSSTIALGQNSKPSGTVTIHQVQVAFIGSGTSGGGTLRFRGKNYSFKLGGLGIGGIGVSRIDASGTVYNLNRLQDFNGVYGQARTGWAAGKSGKGEMWLQNTNGVYLRLGAQRKGLSLSLGADGMVIQLGS